jgi:hypothetical protein
MDLREMLGLEILEIMGISKHDLTRDMEDKQYYQSSVGVALIENREKQKDFVITCNFSNQNILLVRIGDNGSVGVLCFCHQFTKWYEFPTINLQDAALDHAKLVEWVETARSPDANGFFNTAT